jgi:hypothetical protein
LVVTIVVVIAESSESRGARLEEERTEQQVFSGQTEIWRAMDIC